MKIHTVSEFVSVVDDDLQWRKRELSALHFQLERGRNHEIDMLRRAAVCLLYAHWQGFITQAAISFLNFVSRQNIDLGNLRAGIICVAIKGRFTVAEDAKKYTQRIDLIELLRSPMPDKLQPADEGIMPETSNLDSAQFQEYARILGIDYSPYETKRNLLDERLVRNRHAIAHGDRIPIDQEMYEDVRSLVLELLELFRNDIQNAAHNKAYLK